MNRNRLPVLVSAVVLALSVPTTAVAEDGNDLGGALTSGKAGVQVRARYEHVDQENISEKANAVTARLRLNYRSGIWKGWSAFAEYDHVFHLLDDFNSGGGTSPGRGSFPVVADPAGSDLNQLYLDYSTSDDWKVRLGRQRILLDNQRFVGGVGWRQNEQTYDALTFNTALIADTTLQYTYVANVRRILGERSAAGADKTNHHLLNGKVKLTDTWAVVGYVYLLDYNFTPPADPVNDPWDPNELRRATSSTSTAGLRVTGSFDAGDGKVSLVGEYARQSDYADSPLSYSADYFHANAMWAMNNGLSIGLGYEGLGSDSGSTAFRTPLATLHKFQGWADRFLATPAAGIKDTYATARFKAGSWNLTGVYHDFKAETGGGDYGNEFDVSAATKIGKYYSLLFKGAFFKGDTSAFPDTNKFWIMFTATY